MALRCVYTDLDGTLLGRDGSLVHDHEGKFTALAVRGLEACDRAGVEVVLKSGRRKAQVMEDARLIGQRAYIYEAGCVLVDGDEEVYLTGDLVPRDGSSIFDQITDSGAPALLLETYSGALEPHSPWHRDRTISHLYRGRIDAGEADALLLDNGHEALRLIDNGVLSRHSETLTVEGRLHAYHLMPREASKARAVALHMHRRGYAREEVIAVGDSREDLATAEVVGRFYLVQNAVERQPDIAGAAAAHGNVEVTESRNGDGFYEAVVRSLAER